MNAEQRTYYLHRAQQSLARARLAQNPEIAGIHLDLYERYLDRAGATTPPIACFQ